ncbi:glycosyltransferase [Streptomyces echinatus]|uniref:Tetratricopeptide (TPR) repeat protein n=1 Tax=Streptomyces echinatus TaxID=67293 RepID=A0A7W9PTP2_9ACTN|nr:glycosyltransferase [Streptomyces echinatus]MBB5927591.1 tetratricopeptide (TPR) repeat protein [Streptomyces echinatus]
MKRTVCLNMIVKDEAPVIRRCLESVRPLIDTWVIVDTGSTDGTQDVIRDVYRDLPGELHERPWKGYDGSRTEAIELARDSADFLFFIDADDVMEVEPGFRMPELTHDAYKVSIHYDGFVYWRPGLVSARLPWRYVGVLHEYIDCDTPFTLGALEGARMVIVGGGGRRRNEGVREKYLRDARVLQEGLAKEPGNARYAFYLAQSWRDAGEAEKAIEAYDRRTTMGGWDEEVYCAHLAAARIAEAIDRPPTEVMDRYLRAYESLPSRAEALADLARLCRVKGQRWPLAYMYARQAARIPYPVDGLLVEPSWYDWQTLDELAVAAFWVGEYEESASCSERLLEGGKLPEEHRERVRQNLELARQRLGPGELARA